MLLIAVQSLTTPALGEDEIVFSAGQIHNLGFTTNSPEKAGARPIASAPTIVVVPQTRKFVVTEPNAGVVGRIFVSEVEAVTEGQKQIDVQSIDAVRKLTASYEPFLSPPQYPDSCDSCNR